MRIIQLQVLFSGDDVDEQQGHGRVEDDLEERVDDDQDGAVIDVTVGELVPDHDHGDTAGEADHDHPCSIGGEIGKRGPGDGEHDLRVVAYHKRLAKSWRLGFGRRTHEGTDNPVQDEGQDDLPPDMYRSEQGR